MSKHVVGSTAPVGAFLDVLGQAGAADPVVRIARRSDPNERVRQAAKEDGFAAGRAQGYEAGFAAGMAEGRARFDSEVAGKIDALADLLERQSIQVEEAVARWCREAEIRLGGLAAAMAARIVAIEVARDPEVTMRVAQEALREVMHGVSVRLRVNPYDALLLRERQAELLAATSGVTGLEIVDDPTIRAGCRVESDGGVIDARIEAMLTRMAAGFRLNPQAPVEAIEAPASDEVARHDDEEEEFVA